MKITLRIKKLKSKYGDDTKELLTGHNLTNKEALIALTLELYLMDSIEGLGANSRL